MATYQSSHTGAEIDAAVDDVSTKLPLMGGTLTGALTVGSTISVEGHVYMANGKYIFAKDSNGENRAMMDLSSSNNLILGSGTIAAGGGTILYGNSVTVRIGGTAASNNALVLDSTGIQAYSDIIASGSVTIGSCVISYSNNKLNFSNGVVAVFSGSTAPSSSTGSDGDIYIQTS